MERLPDGTTSGNGAPAAWSPPSSRCCAAGTARGSAGRAFRTATRTRSSRTDLQLYPVRLSADDVADVLRGLLQRHAVAAVPRRHRQADLPPRVVGPLRRREPALRRGHLARAAHRARRCGCRTISCSWCRRCCGCCGRISPSDSFCTSRFRPSSCSCRCRGARRSSRGCWAPTWSASSCPAARRTSSSWHGASSARTHRARRSVSVPVSARSRSASAPSRWARFPSRSTRPTSTSKARDGASGSARGRSAPNSATRARSCSASTGSTTPRASTFG